MNDLFFVKDIFILIVDRKIEHRSVLFYSDFRKLF